MYTQRSAGSWIRITLCMWLAARRHRLDVCGKGTCGEAPRRLLAPTPRRAPVPITLCMWSPLSAGSAMWFEGTEGVSNYIALCRGLYATSMVRDRPARQPEMRS
jgi:hypothetical protein